MEGRKRVSTESEKPFGLSGDKPLRMKAVTLGAIICAAVGGAMYAENIRKTLATQGEVLGRVVEKQESMSYKLDHMEWQLTGKHGPAPDKP